MFYLLHNISVPYACLHIHPHIHILLHASNIGWRTNERSLYIKLLLSSYHHNVWNQFFCIWFFIANYEIIIKLWEAKNYFSFHTLYNGVVFLFSFAKKWFSRECIIQNGDMLWYAFTSGKCISYKHVFNYRFACSSIIRVVSIASSLQLFAPKYVYNDREMPYAGKKRMSIKRQELLHSHI